MVLLLVTRLVHTLLWIFQLLWTDETSNKTLRNSLREIKTKIMNLCKAGFLILSIVFAFVDSDSIVSRGQKCTCGHAVNLWYVFFFTKYQIPTSIYKNILQIMNGVFSNLSCTFQNPNIFSNLNSIYSDVLYLKNLQEQV